MKERSEQDFIWNQQKKINERINRLLLDGFYKGKFYRPLRRLPEIEVKEAGSYPELGIEVYERIHLFYQG